MLSSSGLRGIQLIAGELGIGVADRCATLAVTEIVSTARPGR
jgi:hypothetical protein